MSSVQPTIKENIESFFPAAILFKKTIEWREEETSAVRKVVAGFGLAASGIGSLIDGIVSLALAILTSPAYLFGSSIPKSFLQRSIVDGFVAGISLTIAQYENIVSERLQEGIDKRLEWLD